VDNRGTQSSQHNQGPIGINHYCTKNLFSTIIGPCNVSPKSIFIVNIISTNLPTITSSNACPFTRAIFLNMALFLVAVALNVRGVTRGSGGYSSFCCNTGRHHGFLLSCPCDVEGSMLRAPLVEEGVDIHMPKYGSAFVGVKGYHGIKVLLLGCYCVVGGNPTILFLPT
jgi:hypothetical protein